MPSFPYSRGLRRGPDRTISQDSERDLTKRELGYTPRFSFTHTMTSDYQASAWEAVLCDPTAGQFTVTLPHAGLMRHGTQVAVVNNSDSVVGVVVAARSPSTVNGATSVTMAAARGTAVFIADPGAVAWVALSAFTGF